MPDPTGPPLIGSGSTAHTTMTTTPPTLFQLAVEARNSDLVRDSLAHDVVFHPPIQFQPFTGRDIVSTVLSIPAVVFAFTDSFRYTNVLTNGAWHGLFFEAELASGRSFEGVDYLHTNDHGLVDELRIMMRPLAQLEEFAQHAHELIAQLRDQQ